ncbi:hypothetical protein GCM10023093_24030 [Nemorincola caseinilytica]|uniref:Glucose/Sorbosone dehydrogenase domain-containing protein n=1 Tax=Nemorincola caseinilytica TaxID=2054315 RepID=A0ABP8NLD0_9BACT
MQGLAMVNGILYASEHGPNTDDEINIIRPGGNYGWPFVRGYCDQPGEQAFCVANTLTAPLRAWTPTIAPCGIDHYHNAMFPSLRGALLMTTLKDARLYRLLLSADGMEMTDADVVAGIAYGRLRDLCISPEGKIYLSTSNSNADGKPPFTDRIIEVTNPAWGHHTGGELVLYPDPAGDQIWLLPPVPYTQLSYIVHDMQGRVVIEGTITPAAAYISLGHIAGGVYHVGLYRSGELVARGRFVHIHQ